MPLSQSEKDLLTSLNLDHAQRLSQDRLLKKRNGILNKTLINDQKSYTTLLDNLKSFISPNANALELGCFNGSFFPLLRRYFRHVSGIDLNPSSVSIAQSFKYDCQVGFIEELPFYDETFDFVLSRHVLEHSVNPTLALSQIHRVLRPGGITANITPHYFPDPEPAHLSQLKSDQWQKLYTDAGFSILKATIAFFNAKELHILAMKL